MSIPTGSYVIIAKNMDDNRIQVSYCRINVIKQGQDGRAEPTQESVCPVKRISRAKIFDSLQQAMYWKNSKHLHSQTLAHCDLQIKEILV